MSINVKVVCGIGLDRQRWEGRKVYSCEVYRLDTLSSFAQS